MTMRVVHVIGFYEPQLGYEEDYLPARQREKGLDSIILTSNRRSSIMGIARTLEENTAARFARGWSQAGESGVPVLRVPLLIQGHGQTMLRNLLRSLRRLDPDLVHCHDVTSPLAGQVALAQRFMRFALVYDSHALYDAFQVGTLEKQVYLRVHRRFIRPAIIRSAASIIALTEETSVLLQKELWFPNSMIKRSSLGVDTKLFCPSPESRARTRATFGIPSDAFVILYTGKIAPWKRVDVLIESFGRLAATLRRKVFLMLVGSVVGEYRQALGARITELRLSKMVLWHGPVPNKDLPAFYNLADVCVWPAASSMAVFEAFACGIPVVLHNRMANIERISPDRGLTYDGTIAQLDARLRQLIDDEGLRARLGGNAMEYAKKVLDWGRIADQTSAIYQEALADRQPNQSANSVELST